VERASQSNGKGGRTSSGLI